MEACPRPPWIVSLQQTFTRTPVQYILEPPQESDLSENQNPVEQWGSKSASRITLSENANYQDLNLALLNAVASNISKKRILLLLYKTFLGIPPIYEDSDDIWEHWWKLYNDVLDLHAPLKKKQIRWITPEITREMSPRNRLFKQYKKNPMSHS